MIGHGRDDGTALFDMAGFVVEVFLDEPTPTLMRGLDAAGVRDRFSLHP